MNIDSIQSTTSLPRRAPSQEATGNVAPVGTRNPNAISETASQSATAQSNSSSNQPADKPTLEHAVQRISEYVSSSRPEINFTIDESTGTQVVKIVDSESKQVIRQMPSEEAIQIAQALDKLQGLFVKDKA